LADFHADRTTLKARFTAGEIIWESEKEPQNLNFKENIPDFEPL
jgi:hypothetical protein